MSHVGIYFAYYQESSFFLKNQKATFFLKFNSVIESIAVRLFLSLNV